MGLFVCRQETRWWPLLLLAVFSFSDCFGRLATRHRLGLTRVTIPYAVALRVLLLFPCIVCSAKQVVFTNDGFSVLFVGLLGLSNGYLGTLCIMMVNEEVEDCDLGMAGEWKKGREREREKEVWLKYKHTYIYYCRFTYINNRIQK